MVSSASWLIAITLSTGEKVENPILKIISFSRSVVSLAVDSDEIGRIFGVFSIFSAVLGSTVGAGFQQLYNKTLDTLPGAFLLVISCLLLSAAPSNLVMYRLSKSFKTENNVERKTHSEITKL